MKQKKLLIAQILCLFMAACSSTVENRECTTGTVRVHINDFTVTYDDFEHPTRAAQDIAEYNNIKSIILAFYNGGTEVYKETQLRDDVSTYKTFGEFEFPLPMGVYTMVVLGYNKDVGDELVLSSPTQAEYTEGRIRETFVHTQEVNVNSTNPMDISATLNRIIAKLQVASTDGRASNATNVRMTMSAGGKAFNPTTGLATVNTGFSNIVGISVAAGSRSSSISYILLDTDEQTMDVTIETLDANGNTLFSKHVENVQFKRNRVTKLTGNMYTSESVGSSFQLETEWLPDHIHNF